MLMQSMLAAVTTAAFLGGGLLALDAPGNDARFVPAGYLDEASRPAERVIIGLDVSRSNPLITNPTFAAKVAARISALVGGLGYASEIHVRTFGSFDATSNTFYYDTKISRYARPDKVAYDVYRLISQTPQLVASGRLRAQARTNILAFLDNVARSPGCADMPTFVNLASDGIEDSQYARLDDPSQHLPDPDGKPFAGCAGLSILGIGVGTNSPVKTARLRYEWSHWAYSAGFARFEGLNDW